MLRLQKTKTNQIWEMQQQTRFPSFYAKAFHSPDHKLLSFSSENPSLPQKCKKKHKQAEFQSKVIQVDSEILFF